MKERLRDAFESFFISVTLINIAIFVVGMLFRPDQKFGYEVFVYPILYGLIGCVPTILVKVDKELSVGQILIRKLIQLALIIVLLSAAIFAGNPTDRETVITALGVILSIVLIFVGVNGILWLFDLKTAERMTEDLMNYQRGLEERK